MTMIDQQYPKNFDMRSRKIPFYHALAILLCNRSAHDLGPYRLAPRRKPVLTLGLFFSAIASLSIVVPPKIRNGAAALCYA
jgi:hypothetical protein